MGFHYTLNPHRIMYYVNIYDTALKQFYLFLLSRAVNSNRLIIVPGFSIKPLSVEPSGVPII